MLIEREKNAKRQTDDQARKLVEENASKRELVATLAEKAVPLDGTLRTLRALQETLPAELWVQTLEITRESAMGGRGTKPIVTVTGMGKELGGSPIGDAYQDFNKRFRKLITVDDKDVKSEPVGEGRTKFTFKIDFQREAVADAKKQEVK